MKTPTIIAICVLPFALCGGVGLFAVLLSALETKTTPTPPPAAIVATEKTANAAPVKQAKPSATLEGFGRLQSGMSYDEVLAIVGQPSEEMSRSAIGDNEAVMYRWKNGRGYLTALFQNGQLTTKAQAGLR